MARTLVRGLGWDVGLPLATYYALHSAGLRDFTALLAAALVAASRVVIGAVRNRVFNAFAVMMVVVFGLGLVLAFASGDPRFLLVKDSITTAVVGVTFLIMAGLGHPLTLAAIRTSMPRERAEEMARQFATVPAVHRWHLKASTVWGLGLLAEASLRVMLIYLLPITIMVVISAGLMVTTFGLLIGWTVWDIKRQQVHARTHS
ncbi:hypothetical protein LQ327_21095 [Actinomycetospora endophytica]|uniref:Intracellular septation protein A n=1 Tax=Actinomycetospora endophytica TaxID=2291215 RepID=A0ABS8PC81_9PSEU|nr:VC0807 family protein [Actinomycetospora endophytica]MCD2195872.1 hypothetical protein [Actinomycetospora endophytica]